MMSTWVPLIVCQVILCGQQEKGHGVVHHSLCDSEWVPVGRPSPNKKATTRRQVQSPNFPIIISQAILQLFTSTNHTMCGACPFWMHQNLGLHQKFDICSFPSLWLEPLVCWTFLSSKSSEPVPLDFIWILDLDLVSNQSQPLDRNTRHCYPWSLSCCSMIKQILENPILNVTSSL